MSRKQETENPQNPLPPIEPEFVERETGLSRYIPTTLDEIAADDQGEALAERKVNIVRALRGASLALTHPSDWVLFKAEHGVTAYLENVGCQRIRDLWGIEVTDWTKFERVDDADTGHFSYSIFADGHSNLTGQTVTQVLGVRYSYEPFIVKRNLPKLQVANEVMKAARANCEGNIVRELTGTKSVPIEELDLCWAIAKMDKKTDKCPKGRGFGTADERAGGTSDKNGGVDQADIPVCDFCDPPVKLVFRAEKGFWGCRNYQAHPTKKMIVNHEALLKTIADRKKAAGAPDEH